jgi:hypothetical protein
MFDRIGDKAPNDYHAMYSEGSGEDYFLPSFSLFFTTSPLVIYIIYSEIQKTNNFPRH